MTRQYGLDLTQDGIRVAFDALPDGPLWPGCSAVRPGMPAPVICGAGRQRRMALMLWGLVPSWARALDRASAHARAETLEDSGFFRAAFKARRCLVPATHVRIGTGRRMERCDGRPMALAGLWEAWGWEGDVLHGFSVVTRPATADLAPGAARVPLVLSPEDWSCWLSGPSRAAAGLLHGMESGVLRVV
ncbi:hypothetical protein AA103196_1036 [Ameyamaea chiangmaiensis NBRC 103196]|uniref:Abasic site processing protein n=1 Tax=Ameyamaea chiangmaiensis TaxID=442969 RepID=A0A850P9R4_9PROT|nr:SOS response-associated peptidase family protein [Ameyamaea chiangmaiensis]MBS4074662.1 SOS response-associated peptidase family protein [Ameyamaea chiangmaiensis]NVN40774.1 SOS response-associated peptidase family protein [Ameyamaea chiangmaiensis]GBQ65033.1 hypothetical protein AA103196_1036 [Ameyamaea chiangmaiensis NBRC 103196]